MRTSAHARSRKTAQLRLKNRKSIRRQIRDAVLDMMCSHSLPANGAEEVCYAGRDRPCQHLFIDSRWPEQVRNKFLVDNSLLQDAYIHRIRGISALDGRSGFVASGLRVIRSSLPYDTDAKAPCPTLPVRAILASSRHCVEKALSLRDPYELNYFHFFNDVLGKFLLVCEHHDELDIRTLIVSRALYEQSWFSSVQRMGMFHGMQWLVQEPGETLVCNDLLVAKSPPHHLPYFERIVAEAHALVYPTPSPHGKRLFLTRKFGVRNQRIPSNQDALAACLKSLGFTILDPASLPWEEQVRALRDCEFLIGVHGAGMTNLIFRGRAPMRIVEIFPPAKIPPHYYWLSMLFGHDYAPVIAPRNFEVDLDQVLETVLKRLEL